MQTVYQTDGEGYYVGEEVAHDDPLTPGAVLIPAGCVVDAPPQAGPNQIAKREGGAWTFVPDYRGTVYWLPDRSRHEITERGVSLPDGALLSEPPPLPPQAPRQVTMRQARLALLGAGLLQQVNDAVNAMPGAEGEAARIEWEYALSVDRASPLVAGLSAALNLTSEQLDALFTQAATL